MIVQDLFESGKVLGKKHHAEILRKKQRWLSRNIPKWIFDNNLLIPYFITESDGRQHLHIIQMPLAQGDKVHFIHFVSREANTNISDST